MSSIANRTPAAAHAVPPAAVQDLRGQLRGELITPADPTYDVARKVYNGMIDRRPALIARCRDVADVMAGVTFAREHGLLLAVRGGAHNGPGLGTCDDGLVIEITWHAQPCKKQADWFSDGRFARISGKTNPAEARWYARVISEGSVRPGDAVR